jgi:hypothetical protein
MSMTDDYLWDPHATPDREIAELEVRLRSLAYRPEPMRDAPASTATRSRQRWYGWAAAASVAILLGGWWTGTRPSALAPWTVAALRGTPVVRTVGGVTSATLSVGGSVETDVRSVARVAVSSIGQADLGPGSRLRLLRSAPSEYRFALEHGTMHARIDAPPRYFLVETASTLATDLGCVYTLSVDSAGRGALSVEEGEVELERDGVRSSVLAGNLARLRPGVEPGLPYPASASPALAAAVERFDSGRLDPGAVDALLLASDTRSTITLWHLLQRTNGQERERVFERLAALSPPPPSVTKKRVMRGESAALQRWRTELQPSWIVTASLWRRAWSAVSSR